MSERRGGPTDLFAVEGQRAYQRSMMVEAGFLGVRSPTPSLGFAQAVHSRYAAAAHVLFRATAVMVGCCGGALSQAASQKRSCVTPNTWMNTCEPSSRPRYRCPSS